jgi:hypothetical protein
MWTNSLPATSATLAVAAAGEDWASGVLASLAAGERKFRDGTILFYGSFSLLTEDLSFSLPAETGDPPDFATLAAEYEAVLAGPPPGLPPDRGAEFEIVFARKTDGTWRLCQDFRGLPAITQRSVELLSHVDQLICETRGSRFFSKLDLASASDQDSRGGPIQDFLQGPWRPI